MASSQVSETWEQAVQWLRSQSDQKDVVVAGYFDDPLEGAVDRYWRSTEWAAIRTLLPAKSGRALDIGAGRGIASYALARDGFEVIALEPDPSELVGAGAIRQVARTFNLPISVSQEYSERIPFDDASFDVVFGRAVLHHTKDLSMACREFFRVLRPGGVFVAVREHVISRPEDLPAFLCAHPLHDRYGGENAFMLDEYKQAIKSAGFRLEQTLAPLRSPINFAPYDSPALRRELASRASAGVPIVRELLRAALSLPPVWALALPVLETLDHRPGRLYSFCARRPP